ncbi:hypothetical protein XELAEV_18028608mg [Xenopus laevis]|uniref:Protein LBH n=2 Tax=Xenopus laevis TaxID=8355 RepID=A0A974CSE3_XENLA|nr:hypothetical protein XELAEV_18028608mg [Xenopus laevis]
MFSTDVKGAGRGASETRPLCYIRQCGGAGRGREGPVRSFVRLSLLSGGRICLGRDRYLFCCSCKFIRAACDFHCWDSFKASSLAAPLDFMSVFYPIHCTDYLRSAEMTEVIMNTPSMDEIGLSPRKDSYQIFPDPSDFERCCKLKDRLPSIVVEPTEGDVESGELRWPPEEFVVDEDKEITCDQTKKENEQ